jgi:Protein of unknown function (DUF3551)
LILALALPLDALVVGGAEAAAFCTYAGGRASYENCGYYTWEQCLAAIRSRGGYCMRNPHDPALWGFDRRGHRRSGVDRSWKP